MNHTILTQRSVTAIITVSYDKNDKKVISEWLTILKFPSAVLFRMYF